LAQAAIVAKRIANLRLDLEIEIVEIETTGDRNRSSPLSAIGGKGVFIRELEIALIENTIDIAIHSLKDVTTNTHPKLGLYGYLKAESVCDILVSKSGYTLDSIPKHAVVGTGSMRRRALLNSLRPDLTTRDIRGNIDTRISKLSTDGLDAILLSDVSLIRLGLKTHPHYVLPPSRFIPAPGQGVIGLETRASDPSSIRIAQELSDPIQTVISSAQLAFLGAVGFDCQTPLGMHSELIDGKFSSTIFRSNTDFTATEFESFRCDINTCISICSTKGLEWKETPLR
jgi:hydroxymethylbilane synthase